jgi:hypothetical protein
MELQNLIVNRVEKVEWERSHSQSPYGQADRRVDTLADHFRLALSDSQREEFETLLEAIVDCQSRNDNLMYRNGFADGVRLILEIVSMQ